MGRGAAAPLPRQSVFTLRSAAGSPGNWPHPTLSTPSALARAPRCHAAPGSWTTSMRTSLFHPHLSL